MAGNEQSITVFQDVSSAILAEQSKYATVPEYIISLSAIYRRGPWKALIESTCELVGVHDPALPEPSLPAVSHFSQGVDLGLRVAHHANNVKFVEKIVSAMFQTDYDPDAKQADSTIDRRDIVAETLIGMARSGIDAQDPNVVLTELWEPHISADYRYQHFFTHGFGFVLNIGHQIPGIEAAQQAFAVEEAAARAELEATEQQLRLGNFDWTKGLSQLGLYDA